MSKAKIVVVMALFAVALASGRPSAAEEGKTLSPAGSCLPEFLRAPEPSPRTEDGCYNMTFCPDDDYCWSVCSTAIAASCVNFVCQFTLPGNPPPPPPGGCPEQRHCFDASHCIYSGGIFGSCVGGVCVC